MNIQYKTTGTCSQLIEIEMDDTKVKSVAFQGGCNGNGKGIASLIKGMEAQTVIDLLKGTTCGRRGTSCPDQLAKALEAYLEEY